MQPADFLKQIQEDGSYLRANAIDVIERISNKDFNLLMSSFATALAERQYSPNWPRTDKIKHVLAYIGPCRPSAVIKELERLDEVFQYPLAERQAIHATIGVLSANGKIVRTQKHEKHLYSL